jgi:alpha-galactosidase
MTHLASLASFTLSNRSSFSTQRYLPMGYLSRVAGTGPEETWIWQVESSASWKWELGDYNDNLYLGASGPSADDHDWREKLAPGEEATSLTASVGHMFAGQDAAFAALTQYRRRIRRPHVDHEKLPIIFNDYMNCLMGDPTEDKILALVGPVAASGAEYFVIDAGWYADDSNWWDDVGEWKPSQRRFPSGFKNLLDKIQAAGLRPGLWIEPEVIGIRNTMAKKLPNDAFFQRDGQRITEKGRYQLDFRHPDVRKHLDEVFDKYVCDFGVGYFKFDYNIEVTQGTDGNGSSSAGAGQLGHNRAYLSWVSSLLDRYPDLVIENCSSGAQRMDYAMLAVHTLQSTSDQQDPEMYSAISATVHTAVAPEQGATWAYPQAEWSDEINALTVVNSLLGRIHLSGRLDIMSEAQLKIVYDGMKVYKDIRVDIPHSEPFWPLGLAGWHDNWLALGMKAKTADGKDTGRAYVAVWRRGGSKECVLPIAPFKGKGSGVKVEFLYPKMMEVCSSWDEDAAALKVTVPETACARLFKLES